MQHLTEDREGLDRLIESLGQSVNTLEEKAESVSDFFAAHEQLTVHIGETKAKPRKPGQQQLPSPA